MLDQPYKIAKILRRARAKAQNSIRIGPGGLFLKKQLSRVALACAGDQAG